MALELDHLFVFVEPDEAAPGGRAFEALKALGLEPSFTRRHVGQGTANVCYAFDNAYLELFYVLDERELEATSLGRADFIARAAWRETGASPFGIACRGEMPGDSWVYGNPSFPPGVSITISTEGDDPAMPLAFTSPGNAPPSEWTDGRAGRRQTAAGFTRLTIERLTLSKVPVAGDALDAFHRAGLVEVLEIAEGEPEMLIGLAPGRRLRVPAFIPT
ncbi:VOC family protein [Pleomorphomonas sp. NRK KF1]|uniref:VOC family protein n=1 Tax=Pleomorphomonas sp. NRK KF1 TaxID=2943000 RepID=UPI002042E7AF|nr:VOC family protein [Pleomorphomonas sp. NRK KF1]MCM5555746.1 VOC family protein [Pleomorphomonas sp. NRK KF1]